MLTYLAPLVVFGLVVFVHELGHFVAAKLVGVYAPVFAFGWGPRLWGFRRGETDYRVSWFPVGGFVAMASRDAEAMSAIEGDATTSDDAKPGVQGHERGLNPIPHDPEALRPFGPKPVPDHRFIESKTLLQKVFVLSAGVIMNAILAFCVAAAGVWAYGKTFGGQFAVATPVVAPVLDSVVGGSPADRGGLLSGDSVVSVNGAPIRGWGEVVQAVEGSPGRALTLGVVRGGATLSLAVIPDSVRPDSTSPRVIGRMGVRSRQRLIPDPASFSEALALGATVTGRMGVEVVQVVKGLFTGAVSVKQLGGPIRIAQVSLEVAQSGLEPLLVLIAFLSINLAVLNLLPIPVLDGGQILIRVAEAVKGGALSARTQEYLMRFGVLAMLALFVLVMFNDIVGLVQ
ncbi:MAG: RIP metalloprotease RseP [Gemmatimonadetes bacterium]|nr:RIP metalloprotease RseP [Gemmatimonadota bacterium]